MEKACVATQRARNNIASLIRTFIKSVYILTTRSNFSLKPITAAICSSKKFEALENIKVNKVLKLSERASILLFWSNMRPTYIFGYDLLSSSFTSPGNPWIL